VDVDIKERDESASWMHQKLDTIILKTIARKLKINILLDV